MDTVITHFENFAAAIPGIGLIFFMWREGMITFAKPKVANGSGSRNGKSNFEEWMRQHYNDELSKHMEEQTTLLREMRDGFIRMDSKLDTIQRFGVPCRDKKEI